MTTDPQDGPTLPTRDGRKLQSYNGMFFASFPPGTAGFLRGISEAALGGVLTAVISYLEQTPDVPPEYVAFVPLVIVTLRTIEGLIDKGATDHATQ